MRPMLAKTLGPKFDRWPCYVQPKLNGVRALYQDGMFQSRDEKFWQPGVLKHLQEQLAEKFKGYILDGELYVHGWKLQRINGAIAVNRKCPSFDTPHVCFHVFDVVDPRRPFSDRWFELYHGLLVTELPHIKAVPTNLCSSREQMDQHFHLYTREGYEGIMLRPDGPYEYGEHVGRGGTMTQFRSKFLWKHKQWEDDEFLCMGTTPGEGKADIGIGALILARKDGTRLEGPDGRPPKVGTGFSDEERIEYAQHPPIGKLIKVRYLCLTDDGIPFNPSFQCVIF